MNYTEFQRAQKTAGDTTKQIKPQHLEQLSSVGVKQMVAVVAVVGEGSFAAAASSLNLTSAAIGNRIAIFETVIGYEIFDRVTATGGTTRATLTAEGMRVFYHCNAAVRGVHGLRAIQGVTG